MNETPTFTHFCIRSRIRAIAFEQGKVKHVFFIAETKGSMSSLELRDLEDFKIQCARKFFAKISSEQVRYDVVDSYTKLMELVK